MRVLKLLTVLILSSHIDSSQPGLRQPSSKLSSTNAASGTSGTPVVSGSMYGSGGQRELRYVVQEEMAIGTILADIVDDAGLDSRYGPEVARSTSVLKYRFMSPPRVAVAVNESTGLISTTGRIDREAVCGGLQAAPGGPGGAPSAAAVGAGEPCLMRLDVVVTPMNLFQIVKISLEILDINDNDPMFPSTIIRHEISESSSIGTGFNIPSATDRDAGPYGVQHYVIRDVSGRAAGRSKQSTVTVAPSDDDVCSAPHFELKVQRKMDGSTEVRLVLNRSLDREQCDVHRVTVVAVDGGDPKRTGSAVVTINVADANDNGPTFEYSSYEVTIAENLAIGTTVAKVMAFDPDVGTNAEIEYQLSQSTLESPASRVFAVDPITGDIIVIGQVDRESSATYRLLVNARNRSPDDTSSNGRGTNQDGPEGHSSTSGSSTAESSDTIVVIHVEDSNDNAPQISVNTLLTASTDVALVPEAQDPGTFVGHVIVRDTDDGRNGRFECTLGGDGVAGDWFRLSPQGDGEYQVVTVGRLDREIKDFYQLHITCKDGGIPPLVSLAQLRVQVTDINDNRPQFERESYSVELLENNYIGAVLLQVKATDQDQGQNAELVYSLVSPSGGSSAGIDTGPFEIDPSTGVIRVRQSINRELQSDFRFSVRAVDLGGSGLESTATVRVVVLDVNDEAPHFRSPIYSVGIDENLPTETEVAVLEATDADAPPSDRFSFELLAGGSLSDAFRLEETSGRLVTTRSLDREEQDVYHLIAVVRDIHSPFLTSTASVTVHVMDTNDHDPVWLVPPEINTTVTVSVRAPTGSVVARVRATDRDVGDNARLAYSFRRDVPDSRDQRVLPFRVDPDTGSIIVSEDLVPILRHNDNVTFLAILEVHDHGVPTRRSADFRRLTLVVTRRAPEVMPSSSSVSPGFLGRYGNGGTVSHLIGDGAFAAVAAATGTGFILLIAALCVVCGVMRRRRHRRRRSGNEELKSSAMSAQQRSPGGDACKYNCRVETLKAITIKDSQRNIQRQQEEHLLRKTSSGLLTCGGKDGCGAKPDLLDCFSDKLTTLNDGDHMTSSTCVSSQYDCVTGGCYVGMRPMGGGCHVMPMGAPQADFNTFPSRVNHQYRANSVQHIERSSTPSGLATNYTSSTVQHPMTSLNHVTHQLQSFKHTGSSSHAAAVSRNASIPVIDIRPSTGTCGGNNHGDRCYVQLPPQVHPPTAGVNDRAGSTRDIVTSSADD